MVKAADGQDVVNQDVVNKRVVNRGVVNRRVVNQGVVNRHVVNRGVSAKSHAAVRLPRALRREQIVRSAARAFLSAGYDKTSMEDVARAAGVTRLIVYRIFESKEALYLAVLSAVLDDIGVRFDFGHDLDGGGRKETVFVTLLAVAREHPDGFRLLWRHTSNQPEFSGLFAEFKHNVTMYSIELLKPVVHDDQMRQWAAESLASYAYESICLWLDNGEQARDAEFLQMMSDGVRAMVTAWAVSALPPT